MRAFARKSLSSSTLAFTLLCLVLGLNSVSPRSGQAQESLENPQAGSFQSGIGVVSGWVCNATRVDIEIDDSLRLQAAYGTSRDDTRQVCGDDGNNGFGLLFNWNLLGDGEHTLAAFRDGVEFARISFVVATLGAEFLNGVNGQFDLPGFPQAGRNVTVRWQESAQNFILRGASTAGTEGNPGGSTARLENPGPGSFQSGIGVISGWVCTANRVDIEIDGSIQLQAAYGTSRDDTQSICGDDGNNGFGLLFNWNLLGDGNHEVRILRNGVEEVARASFAVTTLGLGEFPRGLEGSFTVSNFPGSDTQSRIQWQESQQNFVLSGEVLPGGDVALCDTQTATVGDGVGGNASVSVTNPCLRDGKTLLLQLQALLLGAQPQRGVRAQSTEGAFFACDDRLEFRQDGVQFTSTAFDWIDTVGNRVCTDLAAGEILETTVSVKESSPLNFNLPVQVLYAGQQVANFSGTATEPPRLTVTPRALNFDTVTIGNSRELSFTVTNSGDGTLTGSATTSAPFSIVSGGELSLSAGQSQTVTVRFTPTTSGQLGGSVAVNSNGGNSSVDLTGTGVAAVQPPQLSVSPLTLDFGNVPVNTTQDQTFTITNTGEETLSGTVSTAAPFSIVSGSPFSLGGGESVTVTVRFSPTAAGPASESVDVDSNGGQASVSVTGTGVLPPQLSVSADTLDFGTVTVGTTGEEMSFSITNDGGGTLTGSVSTAAPFSIVSGAAFSLGGGQSQTVTVHFTPTVAGSASGTATITSNGGNTSVKLVGTGALADLVVRSIDKVDVNCSPGTVPGCRTTVSFTIGNNGATYDGVYNVRLDADPNQSVVVEGPTPVPSAGSVSFEIITPPGGNCFDPDCTVCVTVDSDNTVPESSERNNRLCSMSIG